MTTSKVRITYDGRLAVTIAQAAQRHGLAVPTMKQAIRRLVADGKIKPLPEGIDERTPLFLAVDLDAALRSRPGKGANLRRAATTRSK